MQKKRCKNIQKKCKIRCKKDAENYAKKKDEKSYAKEIHD